MAGLIVLLSLIVMAVGVYGLIRGSIAKLHVPTRRIAALILVSGFVLFVIAGAIAPKPQRTQLNEPQESGTATKTEPSTRDKVSNSNESAASTTTQQKAVQPIGPPQPSAANPSTYASGGLGLSRTDWERAHGSPTQNIGGMINYEGNKYTVTFADDNASYIEYTWGDRNAVTLDDARLQAKLLVPSDAKLVRAYTPREGRTADLYMSESLKSRFRPIDMPSGKSLSPWIGGKPGNFLILYRLPNNHVTSLVIALGNNP
jgi:hypothetical protein